MDSLTQAVLGAAIGEAFLGRKLGNKAMLWGALVGTLPDLDVLGNQFIAHPIDGLRMHRGLSHSIIVTILMPFLLAFGAQKYYSSGLNRSAKLQKLFSSLWIFLYIAILATAGFFAFNIPNAFSIGAFAFFLAGLPFWYKSTRRVELENQQLVANTNYKEWYLMFFFGWLTHWLIDAGTAYGTQIFEPFSDYRVSFNNISIVDPLYTLPFLIFLGACYFARSAKARKVCVTLALGLSTAYMVLTFVLKGQVNTIVDKNIALQNIQAAQYVTTPSMFNTILWQVTVETPDSFYYGMYSLLDRTDKIKFTPIPKQHELLTPYLENKYVQTVLWFVQGLYTVVPALDNNGVIVNNLRFGLMTTNKEDLEEIQYGMGYWIRKDENGEIQVSQGRGLANTAEERAKQTSMMTRFMTQTLERMKGIDDFELKTETLVPIDNRKDIEFKQIDAAKTE